MNTMEHYDLIVVLGSKPDTKTWQFPAHVIASLDKAAGLFRSGAAAAIAVSGGHALSFDKEGIAEPHPEAEMMADYLTSQGIPADKIYKESQSEDTISNLYFLKQTVFIPQKTTNILFITADFRLERLRYVAEKILGPEYQVSFQTVPSQLTERYPHETSTLERTRYYLDAMRPGDDQFVSHMFYDHPLYTAPWPPAKLQALTVRSRLDL